MSTHVSLSKAEAVDAYWYLRRAAKNGSPTSLSTPSASSSAIAGCSLLVITAANSGSVKLTAALVVYSAGLLAMLGCSALYNSNTNEKLSKLLERFDLSGIFLMIAASYTPFMLAKLDGPGRLTVLADRLDGRRSHGVAMNLLARWNAPQASISRCIWCSAGPCFRSSDKLIHSLSPLGLGLLAAGGILYTIGVIFHVKEAAVQLGDLARLRHRGGLPATSRRSTSTSPMPGRSLTPLPVNIRTCRKGPGSPAGPSCPTLRPLTHQPPAPFSLEGAPAGWGHGWK